jgi:hypothetical protein
MLYTFYPFNETFSTSIFLFVWSLILSNSENAPKENIPIFVTIIFVLERSTVDYESMEEILSSQSRFIPLIEISSDIKYGRLG